MAQPLGYNPILHDCELKGCWNQTYRPPIHFFAGALPRKIAMTDIDATVEVNGSFLFLEWKSHRGEIPTGQRIYFERITALSEKITAVVVMTDGPPTNVIAVQAFRKGRMFPRQECDFEGLVHRVHQWAAKVDLRVVSGAAK